MSFLFFDMDGTLISRTTNHIPDSAVQAIRTAMDQGHYCFLCTGRCYGLAIEHENELVLPGVVFSNGAGIAWKGEILETKDIPHEVVDRIVLRAEMLSGAYGLLTVYDNWLNAKQMKRFADRFPRMYPGIPEEEVFRMRRMSKIDDYREQPVQKIDVNLESLLIADVFFSGLPEEVHAIRSGGYLADLGRGFGEITCKGIDKGSGIERVLARFGGTKDDAYCFGDSMNDIDMFKVCAHSVAMGNAREEVKAAAEFVTGDPDHNGIADGLKRYGLI